MKEKQTLKRETHEFGPCYDAHSEVLILGSFPSQKSRDVCFYYGHPKNRFWPLMKRIFNEDVPDSVEGRKAFVLKHGIALYDTIESCDIKGSSDTTIKNVTPTDLSPIINKANIRLIILTGRASQKVFKKYQSDNVDKRIIVKNVPSTSNRNTRTSFEEHVKIWGQLPLKK